MSLDNRSRCGRRDPADTIIRLLGGDEAVAAVLGVSRGAVGKWTYGSRDGRDGEIPRQYREALIVEARRQGWDLQFEHFAWRPPGEPPPDIRRIEDTGALPSQTAPAGVGTPDHSDDRPGQRPVIHAAPTGVCPRRSTGQLRQRATG